LLFDLSDFFGDFTFLNVHDLFVFTAEEKLFSLFFLIIFLSAPQLLINFIQLLNFTFIDLHIFLFEMVDHSLDISFFLVQIMTHMGVTVPFDLMEFVEMKFIVRVVVVIFFSEPFVVLGLIDTLFFDHQQL